METAVQELNWNLLRTFFAIAEERSITKAAARLGLRQPSVSSSLQKLEAQLGCQLVFRDSRSFELTLRGEKVYQECKEIFLSTERIHSLVRDATDEEQGELNYHIISNLTSPLLDELFRLYHQRYPSVMFRGKVQNSQDILESILKGNVSIGICLLPKPVVNLPSVRLFREEFKVFCGAEHAYFGQSPISLRDLRREPFISFSCATDASGLEPMTDLRNRAKIGQRTTGESTNFEEVRRMIVAGLGIGILPYPAVKDDVENGVLWPIEIADEAIGADVYLVHASEQDLKPSETKFVELVKELKELYPDLA
ncbi:LysR family transcriptional regulator [Roseibium porphyridii]|uniref:LysR family transcriptional regulator n=1 Tax=Roseibium porphyridii TaxID=2866279 RepID=A0ABY8F6Z2_9HYPH|nr:LysR family transcriptional regulator [Roseibium sp. KMA01]WFE89852.1 LysR family transcriptional regulator [Roseibium sp. KMA01]